MLEDEGDSHISQRCESRNQQGYHCNHFRHVTSRRDVRVEIAYDISGVRPDHVTSRRDVRVEILCRMVECHAASRHISQRCESRNPGMIFGGLYFLVTSRRDVRVEIVKKSKAKGIKNVTSRRDVRVEIWHQWQSSQRYLVTSRRDVRVEIQNTSMPCNNIMSHLAEM